MSTPNIRDSLERLSAAIAADPAKSATKNHPATARLTAGLQCEMTGPRNERYLTDMPPAMGGGGTAPNPGWFLRGAAASCTATVIAMRAAKLGIVLKELEVTVDTDADLRGILGLDEKISAGQSALRMKVRIVAPGATPETLRELVHWAEAHSPVSCTLKQAPACSLEIEVA